MAPPPVVPLKWPRAIVYFITFALAIVSSAATIDGFVKAHDDQKKGENTPVPLPGLTIHINITDVVRNGGILLAGTAVTALVSLWSLVSLFVPRFRRGGVHLGTILVWVFALLWTFGAAVAVIVVAKNNGASIKAYLAGQQVDPNIVKALQSASGMNPAYWSHAYTRFFAIMPWPLIAFIILSLILTLLAYRGTRRYTTSPSDGKDIRDDGIAANKA